jgi:archaellum component FlaG (FlaF/FlaG flagellin family)
VGAASCSKRKQDSSATTAVAAPKLEIVEKTHDFGKVTEGEKLNYVFTVKNVGKGSLLIDRVTTSCGCTAAVLKKKVVAPGGEGQVEVTFDTNHRGGDNRKTITVLSNDPNSPRAELEIRADVEVLLAFEPGLVRLTSEPGKRQVAEAWLTGKLKEQAQLKLLDKLADTDISAEIAEKTLDGGVGVQGLRFALTGKKLGYGDGNLSIATGLAKPDKLQIGYHWTVAGNIQVIPEQLYFTGAKGNSSDRVLRVTSRKADFKLRQSRILSGPFVASITVPDSGVGYEVHVSLRKDVEPPKTVVSGMGKLELVSNDPLEPKKEIPLRFVPSFPSSAIQAGPAGLPGRSDVRPAPMPTRREAREATPPPAPAGR